MPWMHFSFFSNAWSHEKSTFECRGHNSRNMYGASYLLRSVNTQNIGFIFIWKMKIFIRYRIFISKILLIYLRIMWRSIIINVGYELWKMIILTVILCQLAKTICKSNICKIAWRSSKDKLETLKRSCYWFHW